MLTLSQLPYPGFVVEKGANTTGFISNKRMAAGRASVLRQEQAQGRRTGYTATFDRAVSPQQVVGPVVIASSAETYGATSGAGRAFGAAGKLLTGTGWQRVSTGQVGQQTAGFTETKELDQVEYQSFVLEWRQANILNQVRIAGNAATLDLTYALTLARLQQRAEVGR